MTGRDPTSTRNWSRIDTPRSRPGRNGPAIASDPPAAGRAPADSDEDTPEPDADRVFPAVGPRWMRAPSRLRRSGRVAARLRPLQPALHTASPIPSMQGRPVISRRVQSPTLSGRRWSQRSERFRRAETDADASVIRTPLSALPRMRTARDPDRRIRRSVAGPSSPQARGACSPTGLPRIAPSRTGARPSGNPQETTDETAGGGPKAFLTA